MPASPVISTVDPKTLEPINNVVELIRSFMNLELDQVVLYNPNWTVPSDDRLYITVAFLAGRPYGGSRTYAMNDAATQLVETTTLNSREDYSINIYSRTDEALRRKEEMLMAFN